MTQTVCNHLLPARIAAALWLGALCATVAADDDDWKLDWALRAGFSIEVDTAGYELPTMIAMVLEPGAGPRDPIYFVNELGGRIRVVTNDRSVHTFAEAFFRLDVPPAPQTTQTQYGLTGLCLSPEQGYVFVSFVYHDDDGVLRNGIARFQSHPRTFGLRPESSVSFTEILADQPAAPSHQIGALLVHDDHLYVGVGDAFQPQSARDLDSPLGKVLRMTLDGKPAPDNPYFTASEAPRIRHFVWASGLRNPFGLTAARGRIFAADNGPRVDRFIELRPGGDYGYDGTDWSIGTNAAIVFSPAVGPVQLAYAPPGYAALSAEFEDRFFLALAGKSGKTPDQPDADFGVVSFAFDFDADRVAYRPQYFASCRGSRRQRLVGAAPGVDGLYIVPLYPLRDGRNVVLRIARDPAGSHSIILDRDETAASLMHGRQCLACHSRQDDGTRPAPPLNPPALALRIARRIESDAWIQATEQLDRLDVEPFVSWKQARAEVRQANGIEKVRLWTLYHLMEPRFDNPASQMPNFGFDRAQAELIVDELIGARPPGALDSWRAKLVDLRRRLPVIRWWHLLGALAIGAAGGLCCGRLWRRRAARQSMGGLKSVA